MIIFRCYFFGFRKSGSERANQVFVTDFEVERGIGRRTIHTIVEELERGERWNDQEGAGGYTPVERRFSRTQKLGEFEFQTRGNAVDRNLHVARFSKRFEGLAGTVTAPLTVEGNEGSRLVGA